MKALYIIIGLSIVGIAVLVYFFFKTEGATVLNPTGSTPTKVTSSDKDKLNSDRI